MRGLIFRTKLAFGVVVLALCGIGSVYGQYTVTGTTAGGGNIVVGTGTALGNLGSGYPLSAGGMDSIIFTLGSVALGSGQDTVYITTPGNSLTNFGTIYGEAGPTGGGFDAIEYYYTGGDQTLINHGGIFGGAGAANSNSYAGEGGNGIYIEDTALNGFTLKNFGQIVGGAGGYNTANSASFYSGQGGNGLYLDVDAANDVVIINHNLIAGGAGGAGNPSGGGYGVGGNGIYVEASAISDFSLSNSGTVTGGAGGAEGYYNSPGGYGVYLDSTFGISGVTINNSGVISGGAGSSSTYADGYGYYGGGNGIEIDSGKSGDISGVTLNNSGWIVGGAGGTSNSYYSTYGGTALEIEAGKSASLSNVSLTNSGHIMGGNAGYGSYAGYAYGDEGYGGWGIYAEAGAISNFTLNNSGTIAGANGADGGNYEYIGNYGGYAVQLYSYGDAGNISITNSGLIRGGNGGSAINTDSIYDYYGYAGWGISFNAGGNLSNVFLNNTGSIIGGNAGNVNGGEGAYDSQDGGDGVYIAADGTLSGMTLYNGGSIIGGNAGSVTGDYAEYSGTGGNGVSIAGYSGLSGVMIDNTGFILGGNGGNILETTNDEYLYGGDGGEGILLSSSNGVISNAQINNSGTIKGGNGGNVADSYSVYYGYASGAGGWGVTVYADEGISGLTISNSKTGVIKGGNGGSTTYYNYDAYGSGGTGVGVYTYGLLNGLTLTNHGMILGGNGGSAFQNENDDQAGYGGDGVSAYGENGIKGLTIFNGSKGIIAGGNGGNGAGNGSGDSSGDGGDGVYLENVLQGTLTNFGVIRGGNAGSGGEVGYAGYGIESYGNGLTINNWGSISAGTGYPTASVNGYPNVAISLSGSNNTVNLNGHSSVHGTIEATANANNVLNLNFTGMSPLAIEALKAKIAAQGNLGNFTGSFTVRGVTYYVDPLKLNINVTSYQLQGLTPNQQAIGAALDSIPFNPALGSPLANLFNAIDQSGNVPLALQVLTPQAYQAYGDLAIQNSSALVQEIDQRLDNIRDGSESIDTTGVGGGTDASSGFSKGGDAKDSKNVIQTAAPEKRWGFFATGNGLFFRGSNEQAKADTAGTVAGVDGKVGDHAIVGALFAYDNAAATLGSNNSKATIESYTGGLYGAWHQDGFYADALGAYTRNNYSSTRNVNFLGFADSVFGNTHGNQYTGNLDGGYDWHATDRLSLGPIVGVQYVHLDVNGFNEFGGTGATALGIGSQDMDSLQSRVGLRTSYHAQVQQNVALAVDLRASWQHEYLNDSRSISASFTSAPLVPFSVQSSSPLRDAADVGLGVSFTFKNRLTLFANYDLIMWRSSDFQQSINGGFRVSF